MAHAIMYPSLFYRDAPAAMDWLAKAFGFQELIRVPDDAGKIIHAEMHLDGAVIMVGSAGLREGHLSPLDVSGGGTQHTYVYIEDPDTHHDRAVANGAEVTFPLEDKDYGGRGYSCLDIEGHHWSFGSYRPEVTPV